jgi:hypothetical protein
MTVKITIWVISRFFILLFQTTIEKWRRRGKPQIKSDGLLGVAISGFFMRLYLSWNHLKLHFVTPNF